MKNKELVARFFVEGYVNKNYDAVMDCLAEDYMDHSPAGARSNRDAVGILRVVEEIYGELKLEILDLIAEGDLVATRIRFEGIHRGECMGIPVTGRRISFEALENFKIRDGKIVESWGYWPDKQIEQLLM